MSDFVLSQLLIAIAIVFDIASFQFKKRQHIVSCLSVAGVLICEHFMLLSQWTAAGVMAIATVRYVMSIFTTAKYYRWLFMASAIIMTLFTFSSIASLFSLMGSLFQTAAAFNKQDKRLRQLMIIGTGFWLLHNLLINSPLAVLMEIVFLCSNLVAYYRFYIKQQHRY